MNIPTPADVFAAFFGAGPQAEPELAPGQVYYGPCDGPAADQPVPYTLTPQAEAVLDAAQPEPEASL